MAEYNVSLGAIAGLEITVQADDEGQAEFAAFTELEDVKSEYSIELENGAILWVDISDLAVMNIEEAAE